MLVCRARSWDIVGDTFPVNSCKNTFLLGTDVFQRRAVVLQKGVLLLKNNLQLRSTDDQMDLVFCVS